MDQMDLAKAVRQACVDAALDAYEDAGLQGLCAEGRWEVAIAAMRRLDLRSIVPAEWRETGPSRPPSSAA